MRETYIARIDTVRNIAVQVMNLHGEAGIQKMKNSLAMVQNLKKEIEPFVIQARAEINESCKNECVLYSKINEIRNEHRENEQECARLINEVKKTDTLLASKKSSLKILVEFLVRLFCGGVSCIFFSIIAGQFIGFVIWCFSLSGGYLKYGKAVEKGIKIAFPIMVILVGRWVYSSGLQAKKKKNEINELRRKATSFKDEVDVLKSRIGVIEDECNKLSKAYSEAKEKANNIRENKQWLLHMDAELEELTKNLNIQIKESQTQEMLRITREKVIQDFNEALEDARTKAIQNIATLESVVEYIVDLFEKSIALYPIKSYEREIRCDFSFELKRDRICFFRQRGEKEDDDTYLFRDYRKAELNTIAEQYGLAAVLSILVQNRMYEKHAQCSIERFCTEMSDNQKSSKLKINPRVYLTYICLNSNYESESSLI